MDTVKDFYNRYNYPKVNLYTHRQEKRHQKLMVDILRYGNIDLNNLSNLNILDAGCGTGDKSIYLSKRGAKVLAIDFSEGQIDEAKRNSKTFGVDLKFRQVDLLTKIDIRQKFDVILCIGVLHHTENPRLGFENLSKLLAPEGKIIIALYHKYARLRYRILRFFIHNLVSRNPDKIMAWLTKSKLAGVLRTVSLPTLYDRYAIPYESYHTLFEVKLWLSENDLELLGFSDNVKGIEQLKLFEKKTLFFVGAKKRKIN